MQVFAWLFGKATTCLANTFSPGPSFQTYSAPSGLVKIVRSIQGLRPLLLITPLRGLNHQASSASSRAGYEILNPSGAGQVPPVGGQVLESAR